jgi:hypothetical protein
LAYRTAALALTVVCSCGGGAKPMQAPDSGVGAPGGRGGIAGGNAGAMAGTAGGTSGGAAGGTAGGMGGSSGGAGAAGAGGVGGAAGSGNCGGYDQPCCGGTTMCANADTICGRASVEAPWTCLRCGVPGAPCCLGRVCDGGCCISLGAHPSSWLCIARGEACVVGGICELDGSCTSCGGTGKECCEDRVRRPGVHWCAVPGTTCAREQTALTGTCEPCGAQDQRCCVATEETFQIPSCPAPLRCDFSTRTCAP